MTTRDAFEIVDRYDRAIDNLEDSAVERLNAAIDASYRNLEKELRASYSGLQSQGALVAAQRKLLIVDELGQALDLIKPEDEGSYQTLLQGSIQAGDDIGGKMANDLIKAYDFDFPLAQFARISLESAALQARDGVQRLSKHSQDFRTAASAVIEQGLIQGWGPGKVTQILRNQVGATKSKAETIARTEISSALNDAADQRYKDNGIKYFQLIVTPSDALCPFCAARNGKVYQVGKMRVPVHPRCRCLKLPWSKSWQDKGLTDDEFIKDFRDRALADLKADGQKPNYGPTHWEKQAGLTSAPRSVWTPGTKPKRGATKKPAAASTPTPQPTGPAPFPDDPNNLKVVRQLGGSTGAELVEDAQGNQFVRKRGSSPEHLREEVLADNLYRKLGANVPEPRLYETDNGPIKLTRFIKNGRPLSELSGDDRLKAIEQLQQHFATDALLGNWDVVGMELDNVLVDETGKAWRIDNGGSLRFRAQGQRKNDIWNRYPTEIWSMRNLDTSESAAEVFGDLRFTKIAVQMKRLNGRRGEIMELLPDDLKEVMGQRLDEFRDVARTTGVMGQDKWKNSYLDRFTGHGMQLRARGITGRLPQFLAQDKPGAVRVTDENGKTFDDLRGRGSIVEDLARYIESVGGDYGLIGEWMDEQAGDSWNEGPQAVKYYYATRRNVDVKKTFWWRDGPDEAKDNLRTFLLDTGTSLEKFERTFSALHAFNYEMMRNIDFTHNDRENGTVKVIRTENKEVMRMNKLKRGDRAVTMTRGAVESSSIFRRVEVFGSEITVQNVPHHRVLGTYFQSRYPGDNRGAFLGDDENEFVVMLDGVEFDYEKTDTFTGKTEGPKPVKPSGKKKSNNTFDEFDNLTDDELFGDTDIGDLAAQLGL